MIITDTRGKIIDLYKCQTGDVIKYDDKIYILGHSGQGEDIIRYMMCLNTGIVRQLQAKDDLLKVELLNAEMIIH